MIKNLRTTIVLMLFMTFSDNLLRDSLSIFQNSADMPYLALGRSPPLNQVQIH